MVETFDSLTENGIIIYIKITVQKEEKKKTYLQCTMHIRITKGFFKRKKMNRHSLAEKPPHKLLPTTH